MRYASSDTSSESTLSSPWGGGWCVWMFSDVNAVTPREQSLVARLRHECTDDVVRQVLVPMIDNNSCVSLRAIDWAVVNWSKKHNVVCHQAKASGVHIVNVHQSYKLMLNRWKRKLFDPFRRRSRMKVSVDNTEYETTLGQLNFAVWLYNSGVYAYIHKNIDSIELDMFNVMQSNKKHRGGNPGLKRAELSQAPQGLCVAFMSSSRVSF